MTSPRPRILLDPERVIVIPRPSHAVGQITVNRQTMRVRVCADCRVATTLPTCPCCDRSTAPDGVTPSERCPLCGVWTPEPRCSNCGHRRGAPPAGRRALTQERALPPARTEEIPEDVIDVEGKER